MFSETKKVAAYSKNLTIISALNFLFAFGCILLGYVFMPFAAASYAALLTYEKKNKRILSYTLPVFILALNVFFNGFLSLEPYVYLVFGLILYFTAKLERTKNETIFYLTLAGSVFVCFSFVVLGFASNESLSFGALRDFYAGAYDTFKKAFINVVTSLSQETETGLIYFVFNRETAEEIFHSILYYIPAFVIVFSFFLSGLAIKTFEAFKKRILFPDSYEKKEFIPTKFISYLYIIFALLAFPSSAANDIFSISIGNIYTVFLFIFAYFGAKMLYAIVSATRGTAFATLLLVFGIIVLNTTALSLLSFIGVFFALTANAKIKNN